MSWLSIQHGPRVFLHFALAQITVRRCAYTLWILIWTGRDGSDINIFPIFKFRKIIVRLKSRDIKHRVISNLNLTLSLSWKNNIWYVSDMQWLCYWPVNQRSKNKLEFKRLIGDFTSIPWTFLTFSLKAGGHICVFHLQPLIWKVTHHYAKWSTAVTLMKSCAANTILLQKNKPRRASQTGRL